MEQDEEEFEIEPYEYPLMDATYVLSFVAMLHAIFAIMLPCFYSVTYIHNGQTYKLNHGLVLSIFDDPDWETEAAFSFLVMTAILSSCGARLMKSSHEHGFGEHHESLPRTSFCLSILFILVGILGFLSLIALSSDTCNEAEDCEVGYGCILAIVASSLWMVCAFLMGVSSWLSITRSVKVHPNVAEQGDNRNPLED